MPYALNETIEFIGNLYHNISPIAFDLNGDGIKYQSLADSKVFFDIDGDKFAEHVEWLDRHDGWLARDLNGNGIIDGAQELFGETGGTSAYAKLAALDSNHDGKLTSADAQWGSLRIWRDVNQNGRTDAGELKTLAEWKITSIALKESDATRLGGHDVAGTSSFTINGAIRQAADVLLQTNQLDSWYVGNGTTPPAIDLETFFMPQSRGYGALPSLHIAMSQNAALKARMEALGALDTNTQMHTVYDKVYGIMYQWAGGKPAHTSVFSDDPVKTAVLNKLIDAPDDGVCRPGMHQAFAAFENEMLVRLLVQGPLQAIFDKAYYSFSEDRVVLGDTIGHILANAKAHAPTATAEKTIYWNEIARILTTSSDELKLTDAAIMTQVDKAAGFKTYVADYLGTSRDDVLEVHVSDQQSHTFYMGAGNDIIDSHNTTTVLYNLGDGHDTIYGDVGKTTLVFGPGITLASLRLSHEFDGFHIGTPGNGDMMIMHQSPFYLDNFALNRVIFSDGSSITMDALEALYLKQVNTSGNDSILGFEGNDVLTDGRGNDTMDGGEGNDSFILKAGGGANTVYGNNGRDTVRFDTAFANIRAHYDNDGFKLTMPDGTSVVLPRFDVERFAFSDGIVRTLFDMEKLADKQATTEGNDSIWGFDNLNDTLNGAGGNDTIYGWNGSDVITGGRGNDYLDGGWDNNIFIINRGDGNDTIIGGGNDQDMIKFGAGITFASIHATYNAEGFKLLLPGGGSVLMTRPDVEIFSFADGTQYSLIELEKLTDRQAGTAGNDSIWGFDNLNDTINGAAGNDSIDGGYGDDVLSGDAGNDLLSGYVGEDTLNGGDGNDSILGFVGNDSLYGGNGDDTLLGGEGDDIINGGPGSDVIDGGAGIDTVSYSTSTTWVNVDLGHNTYAHGDANRDSIVNVENLIGSNYNDQLLGDSGANTLRGLAGNDTLSGGGGNDVLIGGAGNDLLNGGAGSDYFYFGAGFGRDTIASFDGEGVAGGDVIRINGIAGYTNFAAVDAATTYNTAASTATITMGSGNILVLHGITAHLTANDFCFG